MKVLILGGTGAMGFFLVGLLEKQDMDVIVTTRRDKVDTNRVRYIKGNALELNFIEDLMQKQWDAIVDFMVYDTTMFKERVNIFLNATSHYVFLSTARVFAQSNGFITENSDRLLDVSKDNDFLKTDEYSLTKARQENILKNSGKRNFTIIRPYITYSNNRFQLGVLEKEEWLYRALKGRTIVFSEDINKKFTTLTHGLDVAKGILASLLNKKTLGETYNITTSKALHWSDVLKVYLNVLENKFGYTPKVLFLDYEKFLNLRNNKYQVIYDRSYDRKFDNSKVVDKLGLDHFIELEDGIKGCLEQFLKNPVFNNINWKLEAMKDKCTKERVSLNEIKGIKPKLKYLLYRYIKR